MKYFILLTLMLNILQVQAQLIVTTNVPSTIQVAMEEEQMALVYVNQYGGVLINQLLTISLPIGVEYVDGTANCLTNHSITALNTTNDSLLTFILSDVAVGDSIKIVLSYKASLLGKTKKQQGQIFRNSIKLEHNFGETNHLTESYNVLFPAISIINVTPVNQTIISGGNASRSFTVINAGNGSLSKLYITDIKASEVNLLSSSIGYVNATKDTIIIEGTDFSVIGNNDNKLDKNESFVLTEILSTSGCEDKTVSSTITPYWGEVNDLFEEENTYANISIDYKTPALKLETVESFLSCFASGEESEQIIKLTNTGSGIATGIEIDIFKSIGENYNQNILSKIDETSFTYQIGSSGPAIPITPYLQYSTNNANEYSCLGNAPVGRVLITIPNMASGDIVYIKWDMLSCAINQCGDYKVKGWKTVVDYLDGCSNTYSINKVGQEEGNQNMSVFPEYDVYSYDASPVYLNYLVTSHQNDLPIGDGAHYKVKLMLPIEVIWNNNINDMVWKDGPISWNPETVDYNNSTGELTAYFYLPAPITFKGSELNITLEGQCGTSGWKNISMNMSYIADTTCSSTVENKLVCDESVSIYLQCPGACTDGGMKFIDFTVNRTTFGLPDNNIDGIPDGSGSLNTANIRTDRVLTGDTLQTIFKGEVLVTNSSPTFNFGQVSSQISNGKSLTYLNAEVIFYQKSSGTYFTCTPRLLSESIQGNDKNIKLDFSIALLTNCNLGTINSFQDGDSVFVKINYWISENMGGAFATAIFDNEFYLSNKGNPSQSEKYQCNKRFGRLTIIGHQFLVTSEQNINVRTCSKSIRKEFKLSLGNCCSNLAGTDFFPFEYRQIGITKEVKAKIPVGYTIDKCILKHNRTVYSNSSSSKSLTILPNVWSNDTAIFDIKSYFISGQLTASDEGFYDYLDIYLKANCNTRANQYEGMPWKVNFEQNSSIAVQTSTDFSKNDNVRYQPAKIVLSSPDRIKDGISKNVVWELKIKNQSTTSHADNSWFSLNIPNDIVLDSILLGGNSLQPVNDVYALGTINKGNAQTVTVHASYNTCNYTGIKVYAGYNCEGVPTTFNNVVCPYTQLNLDITPRKTELQTLTHKQMIGDVCGTRFEIEQEVSSVYYSNAYNLMLDVIYPANGNIVYEANSSQFKYNMASTFNGIGDPTIQGNIATYNLSNFDSRLITNGLPGILDLSNNTLKIKFISTLANTFKPGDYIITCLRGISACGDTLPTIYLAHDPSAKFSDQNIAGLDLDAVNSWSASWGDYNNDGYDDLFLPNYDNNEPNILYTNNTDGTFSKVTSGSLVQDLGSSLAGSWGDYDNDGDLDLFVANNTNANNNLYQNNGDNTFTKIIGDDVTNHGGYCHSASWVDYDNDGYLDVFVSDYMPTDFNALFHNNGDGTFSKVTQGSITSEANFSIGSVWGDYDNDGDLDLFVTNTNGENNSLYRNDNRTFTRIQTGAIVTDGGKSVGASWGDYNNDGYVDLFVANTGGELNFLYQNNTNGTFTRIMNGAVATVKGNSHGSAWGDYNNDGYLDLFVTNDQGEHNMLFANNGDGTFTAVNNTITQTTNNSFGTAWSDYDNDGDIDLFIANHTASVNDFYVNEQGNCKNYTCFKLIGTNSNKSAIGARIRVKANLYGIPTWQLREISGQTGGGSGGQNSLKASFGLGDATVMDSIIIDWPSGFVQTLTNQAINFCNEITEPEGTKVCGVIYNDTNNNCLLDNLDVNVFNIQMVVKPLGRIITTDQYGQFETYLPNGTYTFELITTNEWLYSCGDSSFTVTVNNEQSICGNNIAVKASCPQPDLQVSLSTAALRRGFKSIYAIHIKNIGAVSSTDNQIELNLHEELVPISATLNWDSIMYGSNNITVMWDIATINPGEEITILLTDSVTLNLSIQDTISTSVRVSTNDNECTISNNEALDIQPIVGAIDPNDKLTLHKSIGPLGFIKKTDALHYKIRFQNTGNYYASRVIVIDTLSNLLNPATIHQVVASHDNYKVYIDEYGVIKWEFTDINLPDSNANEPESHGYVSFKILARDLKQDYAVILNKAYIQFDFNKFIKTNTVVNTMVNDNSFYLNNLIKLKVYPNPTQVSVSLSLLTNEGMELPNTIHHVEVFDVKGNKAASIDLEAKSYDKHVSLKDLGRGVYFIIAIDTYGYQYRTRVVKM